MKSKLTKHYYLFINMFLRALRVLRGLIKTVNCESIVVLNPNFIRVYSRTFAVSIK